MDTVGELVFRVDKHIQPTVHFLIDPHPQRFARASGRVQQIDNSVMGLVAHRIGIVHEVCEHCRDSRARSEIIAAVLAAYFQSSDDEIARMRELLKQYRTEKNS